jgi:sortase A
MSLRTGFFRRAGRGKLGLVPGFVVLLAVLGIGLLLYPALADLQNRRLNARMYGAYSREVGGLSPEKIEAMWRDAQAYNRRLADDPARFLMTEEKTAEYLRLLSPDDTGIMGQITIPAIRCREVIYHGTDEGVLQVGAGHLAGSSLPVGGMGVHTVLVGHRGLPSARLFTDLDRLKVGDEFSLDILGRTLLYRVDQILVVDPDDQGAVDILPDRDYCTLLTCTPYGVNTQRLLVRGVRETAKGKGGK